MLLVGLIAGAGYGGFAVGKKDGAEVKTITVARDATRDPLHDWQKRLRDWQIRRGDDWALYKARFSAGYEEGCSYAFIGDGRHYVPADSTMYDDAGKAYVLADCRRAFPRNLEEAYIPPSPPDDPSHEGFAQGAEAGCHAIILSADSDLHGTSQRTGNAIKLTLGRCGPVAFAPVAP